MQFEALKVFCDVARQRSFSQAADVNDLTQSAVSQIVQQLERRLGAQLVDRATRPLQLTPLGQTYYEGCKGLVEQYQELEAAIRQAQDQLAGSVQVAAIYSVGLGDMGQLIERFQSQQPRARVHIEYLHPDRVYEKVQEGTADFGLVSFPSRNRQLTVLPWREEVMVLACPPTHALAGNQAVRPSELENEKFVGFDKGLVIRREVDRFLREHGAAVDLTLEFDNIETIKKAVEVGAGVALLPEPTLRREVAAGTLVAVPLQGTRLVRPLGIIQRRRHKLSTTATRLIDMLRQSAERNGSAPHGPSSGGSPIKKARHSRNGSARASRKAV